MWTYYHHERNIIIIIIYSGIEMLQWCSGWSTELQTSNSKSGFESKSYRCL